MINTLKKLFFSLVPEQKKWEMKNRYSIPSMEWSLSNMKRNGFVPKHILDIGAYEGEWTEIAKVIFPEAHILMLEAQSSKKDKLQTVCQKFSPSVSYQIGLLGAENKAKVVFHEGETVSSVLTEHQGTKFIPVAIPMLTLDTIMKENYKTNIDFIKLDVQGYELEVLKGASQVLQSTQAVLMEVALIDIYEGSPLMHQVTEFMYLQGFIAYDICSFIRRPLDKALWQIDMIFVRQGHSLLLSKKWGD